MELPLTGGWYLQQTRASPPGTSVPGNARYDRKSDGGMELGCCELVCFRLWGAGMGREGGGGANGDLVREGRGGEGEEEGERAGEGEEQWVWGEDW